MTDRNDGIITSQGLKKEYEQETGKTLLENNKGNRYAYQDDSFDSVPDALNKTVKEAKESEKSETEFSKMSGKEKAVAAVEGLLVGGIVFGLLSKQYYVAAGCGVLLLGFFAVKKLIK